jgi:hypothetical protein
MTLESVSRRMFDEVHGDRHCPSWPHDEVEWFVERTRTLIAYIARNMQSSNWLFVIEGRDERGRFHEVQLRDRIPSQAEARGELEKELHRLLATGVKVFSSVRQNWM